MNIALKMLDKKERGENYTSECNLELDKRKAFEKKIENLCGLFVSVINGKVDLIHQTAKEFLITTAAALPLRDPSIESVRLHQWPHI